MKPLPAEARRSLAIYRAAFPLVFLALLPGFLVRLFRRGNFRDGFGQRFGRYAPGLRERFARQRPLWIHAISVGETLLALKLIRELQQLDPALPVVLSATTATGHAVAQRAAAGNAQLTALYNPVDAPSFVRRALAAIQPRGLVFIEAIWPNLLAQAASLGLPVSLIPRLSERSEKRFRAARRLTGPIFRLLDRLYLQEAADAPRWQSLGVHPDRLHVTRNIKYDQAATAAAPDLSAKCQLLRHLGVAENAPILIGGSTFPGEEKILAEALRDLRPEFPDLFLILVPRHVERAPAIGRELAPLNFNLACRTELHINPQPSAKDILLIDTTGELGDWYHLSTVAFIGKSLTAHGGQNPVEAVLAGKPVIFGPHMSNFRGIVNDWLQDQAAIQIQTPAELKAALSELLSNPTRRQTLTTRAQAAVSKHQGATKYVAELILRSL